MEEIIFDTKNRSRIVEQSITLKRKLDRGILVIPLKSYLNFTFLNDLNAFCQNEETSLKTTYLNRTVEKTFSFMYS